MNCDEELKKIKDEVIALKTSPLYAERMKNKYFPVIGEGNHLAEIMFVGEAPGENEAKTCRPFCSRAGKVLDLLLADVGIERKNVYVTNIVKDRMAEKDALAFRRRCRFPYPARRIAMTRNHGPAK